jgi:hypothetical protein
VEDLLSVPVVRLVRDRIVGTLDRRLVGLYVYGSLVTGAFEPTVSDVDLIAALADEPDEALLPELSVLHADTVRQLPDWDDRVEVDYVSARGLADCRTASTTIARISPGEPVHLVQARRDFLLDWYPARRDGIALVGPPIASVIPLIPESEYLDEVRMYLASFRTRFDPDTSAGSQAYAILTMCRGFYALAEGARMSKRNAGLRARSDFPRWADLIDLALAWRDRQWDPNQPDASGAVDGSTAFIHDLADRLDLR